jgi:5-hydroxyisourate hydrolase-like protein (transthyretin family)
VGPKALKLFGHVVDAITKKPINGVRITLRRVENPGAFFETGINASGSFRVLVPQVPFTLEVSAPGYERKNLGTLTLKDGEPSNKLEVTLRKSP